MGKSGTEAMLLTITQLATRFIVETYTRAKSKEELPRWFATLHNLFSMSPQACSWFVVSQQSTHKAAALLSCWLARSQSV